MTDNVEKKIPALPQETVEYILSCLDGRTLGFAEQVCVQWNRLCKLKKVWTIKYYCIVYFNGSVSFYAFE